MNKSIGIGAALVIGILFGSFVVPAIIGERSMRVGMTANIDKHFIEQMIPHHEGAIEMAELALETSQRPEILLLAENIIEAQTSEIEDMTRWYGEWFGGSPTSAHGMHMHGMEGDAVALQAATDFDKEFLAQMIVHHEMAVMMGTMLAAGTERPEMKQLANQIITSQTQEIEMMRGWLSSW